MLYKYLYIINLLFMLYKYLYIMATFFNLAWRLTLTLTIDINGLKIE